MITVGMKLILECERIPIYARREAPANQVTTKYAEVIKRINTNDFLVYVTTGTSKQTKVGVLSMRGNDLNTLRIGKRYKAEVLDYRIDKRKR